MEYTTVTVSVPEGRVADLLRYAATLASEGALADGSSSAVVRGAVKEVYMGGVSHVWRPFLEYLAERPDEWVPWPDLCKHIDRTPAEASGMLGAAERRMGDNRPYEKKWFGKVRNFRMPADAAEVIRELREASDE